MTGVPALVWEDAGQDMLEALLPQRPLAPTGAFSRNQRHGVNAALNYGYGIL